MESSTVTTTTSRARSLSVRFEDTCVLIPQACRTPAKSSLIRPRLITKSYSLPLWKTTPSKKSGPAPQSLVAALEQDAACAEAEKERAEKKAFSLTVSVPSFTKSKPRRPSLPLPSPCLSRRNAQCSDTSTPPTSPISPTPPSIPRQNLHRMPSVPQIQPANLKQADSVPLRACCEACHPCVDAALAEGEHWSEKWSSGAVRRYSEGEHVHLHAPHPAVFGITRVWTPAGGCEADADADVSLGDALKIDEVEVKRRSGDFSHAVLNNRPVPPSAEEDALVDSDDDEPCPCPCPESTPAPPLFEPTALSRCRAAILQEEDEDLLFPLPSPRRSPSQSPNLTPTGSQTNLSVPPSGSQTNLSVPLCGSQTNLAVQTTSQARKDDKVLPPTPVDRPSPSISIPPAPATPPAAPSSPAPASASPTSPTSASSTSPISSSTHKRQRSASPTVTRRPQARRPSFSSASGSLLKGSASVLRGVAAGMTGGVGASVGVVR